MFLWFVGTAIAHRVVRVPRPAVRLPAADRRSVLPARRRASSGGAGVLHTLVFSVVLLVVVMLATVGRRPVRKLLLGLPIGTMLHLVFDGAWATTDAVLVAARRLVASTDAALPEAARGWWDVPLELVGARDAGVDLAARRSLGDPARAPARSCATGGCSP